jgi:hypothetical protein
LEMSPTKRGLNLQNLTYNKAKVNYSLKSSEQIRILTYYLSIISIVSMVFFQKKGKLDTRMSYALNHYYCFGL